MLQSSTTLSRRRSQLALNRHHSRPLQRHIVPPTQMIQSPPKKTSSQTISLHHLSLANVQRMTPNPLHLKTRHHVDDSRDALIKSVFPFVFLIINLHFSSCITSSLLFHHNLASPSLRLLLFLLFFFYLSALSPLVQCSRVSLFSDGKPHPWFSITSVGEVY